ncbi:hypothetical protein [Synechococcus sp. MIT S9504]
MADRLEDLEQWLEQLEGRQKSTALEAPDSALGIRGKKPVNLLP